MPSRSRLYSLEPIGIGTPETESLTSYVSRLAAAHSLRVRDLVIGELLDYIGRPHLADGRNANLLTAFWRNETRALNGTRSLARKMVQGLESLTGRHDLRFLTLLTWTEVLPVHQLQKSTRAWCPGCFQDWREKGRVIYDPLIWTLAPVTVCPRHRRPLRMTCPFPDCRRPSPWLSSRSRPGCCARCGAWLGDSGPHVGTEQEMLVMDSAVRSHSWIYRAIGELIGAAPTLTRHPRREHLVRSIQAAFREAASRKITMHPRAWMRQLGLANGTVLLWRQGRTLPSLWCLLVVSSQVGISPLQLLCGQVDSNTWSAAPRTSGHAPVNRPPTRHTPVDPKAVHRALEAVLASDETPPPSLREVADRLGQTYTNLRHYFPELSRAIAARYRSYLEAQGERTRARVRDEVRQAAIALTQQGDYPSTSRIAALLNHNSAMRTFTARMAWHEVLRELGWRT